MLINLHQLKTGGKTLEGILYRNFKKELFYLTKSQKNSEKIPNVRIIQFNRHREPNPSIHHYIRSIEDGVLQGQAVVRELINLANEGIKPDFIFSHGGNGLGLFIKKILLVLEVMKLIPKI